MKLSDWRQKPLRGNLVGEPVQIGLPKAQCFGSGARLTPAMQYASCHWGRLAQLVERFVYTEDVGGSSPSSPTISFRSISASTCFSQNLLLRLHRSVIALLRLSSQSDEAGFRVALRWKNQRGDDGRLSSVGRVCLSPQNDR